MMNLPKIGRKTDSMACMGPSQEYAFKQADEAYNDIVDLLKTRYYVYHNGVIGVIPEWKAEQEENFKKLRLLLKDIIWLDHCIGF